MAFAKPTIPIIRANPIVAVAPGSLPPNFGPPPGLLPKPREEAVAPTERHIAKRRRLLACPICKKLKSDGSVVQDGEVCRGGHMRINNVQKIWQCQQCQRRLSIHGSWAATAKRHFNDDGVCTKFAMNWARNVADNFTNLTTMPPQLTVGSSEQSVFSAIPAAKPPPSMPQPHVNFAPSMKLAPIQQSGALQQHVQLSSPSQILAAISSRAAAQHLVPRSTAAAAVAAGSVVVPKKAPTIGSTDEAAAFLLCHASTLAMPSKTLPSVVQSSIVSMTAANKAGGLSASSRSQSRATLSASLHAAAAGVGSGDMCQKCHREVASVDCKDCRMSLCEACDTDTHDSSLNFLRNHHHTRVARRSVVSAQIPSAKASGSFAPPSKLSLSSEPNTTQTSSTPKLVAFPSSGSCISSSQVMLSKLGEEPLFPNTPHQMAQYSLELISGGHTCAIKEFRNEDNCRIMAVIPPYMEGTRYHPPHDAPSFIKVSEIAFGVDPPLTFEFSYKHCEALDGAHMVENLTLILKRMLSNLLKKAKGKLSAESAEMDEAQILDSLRLLVEQLLETAQTCSPEALQQLKKNKENLEAWRTLAQDSFLSSRFLKLLSEEITSSSAEPQMAVVRSGNSAFSRDQHQYDKLFLAVCCMVETGVRFVPLLWSMCKSMNTELTSGPLSSKASMLAGRPAS